MTIDDQNDVDALQQVGAAVADARETMARAAVPGVSTAALDRIGAKVLKKHGARSAPRLAYEFPGHTCISVNSDLAHGIPSTREILQEGDLINIDVSAEMDGYWADTGASFAVGEITAEAKRLLRATHGALEDAMVEATDQAFRRNIGRVVERRAKSTGFFIIEELEGHGVGRHIHEAPSVSHVFNRRDKYRFHEGQVITIEPFLTVRPTHVVEGMDGWTLRTANGCIGAQFEHTLILTRGEPIVVTA